MKAATIITVMKKKKQINTLFFTSINTQTKKKTRKKSCLKREYIGYKQVRLIKYTFVTIKHLIVKNVGKRTPSEHKKKVYRTFTTKKKKTTE